jgi:adenylosuccinate synthase
MRAKVEDVTDNELSEYDIKVQNRIKKLGKGYHDERRAKEQALREREATESYAKQLIEENKKLQHQISSGSKVLIEQSQLCRTASA